MSEFEKLLDSMVPGIGQMEMETDKTGDFPAELGLIPMEMIGKGGTGWVYRAEDPVLGRTVAVKISRTDGGDTTRETVLQEARITAALQCPGVLPVHRVVETADQVCVIFKLAPERTLADLDITTLSTEKRWALLHTIIQTLLRF